MAASMTALIQQESAAPAENERSEVEIEKSRHVHSALENPGCSYFCLAVNRTVVI
jgi:hypothetical protein